MLEKLQISLIHRLVRGANVPIAVIDSEIDVSHPDLAGDLLMGQDQVAAALTEYETSMKNETWNGATGDWFTASNWTSGTV